MAGKVFLDHDQQALDRGYDPRAWVPNWEQVLKAVHDLSQRFAASFLRYQELAYGPGELERLDLFCASQGLAPIHIHSHGGA